MSDAAVVYRPWDREDKLGPPPWRPDDPKVIAWQEAHGHDVRLKCYPEFGCQVAHMLLIDAGDALVEVALYAVEWDHPALERWRRERAEWTSEPCPAALPDGHGGC